LSAVPKPSFDTKTSPFPFQNQQKFDFDKLPEDLKQALNKAIAVQTQPQPSGWNPTKAPQVQMQPSTQVPGAVVADIPFPPPQPPQPQPQPSQMPQYVQQQFQQPPAAAPQQQWAPTPPPPQQQQPLQPIVQPQQQRPLVAFLICSHGTVDARFAQVMMRLANLAATAGCDWTYMMNWKYGVAETRMRLLLDAMNIPNLTHVCYIDSDIIPDGDDALAYLISDNVPFASGLYWNSFNGGYAAWVGGQVIGPEQPAPVVPVDQVGMGFCLLHVSVFQTLKERGAPWPWFYLHIEPNQPRLEYGEDFFFESLCNQCGIRPHVDMRVKCSHIKNLVYQWDGQTHP